MLYQGNEKLHPIKLEQAKEYINFAKGNRQ